jgi:uncharacterized protein YecE (DUF72 family)
MNLRVGTSGFSYPEWKGSFYPEKIKSADMLRFYAERFGTVEMNNTFYRMPTPKTVTAWAEQVPPDFRFVLKAPQRITHFQRLQGVEENVVFFLNSAIVLADRLGPLLFQLPPNMKKDLDRLTALLGLFPAHIPVAMEYRHESWFSDDVYDAMRAKQVALCIADTDEGDTPLVSTAPWGYLRLRREAYDDADLTAWHQKIRGQPWESAYVFFKHEDEGTGPRFARRFVELGGVAGAT